MPNDNNASIRYLMKEMDPSEEVLMEREMMEDDNLLIEVESMRKTLHRLDELPLVNPPHYLTEYLIDKAAVHSAGKPAGRIVSRHYLQYAAVAAVVVVSFMLGGMFMSSGSGSTPENGNQAAAAASTGSTPGLSPVLFGSAAQLGQDVEPSVQPWVDREDILHFQDRFNPQMQDDFNAILSTSAEKLTPLDSPLFQNTRPRSLQLTGSPQ